MGPGRTTDEVELLLVEVEVGLEVVIELEVKIELEVEVVLEVDEELCVDEEGWVKAYAATAATMIKTTTIATATPRPIARLDLNPVKITALSWLAEY